MFFRRRFLMRTILLLLLIAIFVSVAGRWSYDAGWRNGYVAAQMLGGDEGESSGAPAPSPAAPYHGWGFAPVGWFFAGLFKFWLLLLLFGLGLKLLFGRGGWRRRGHRGRRHHHWHGSDEWNDPREKSPEDVEPDIRSV